MAKSSYILKRIGYFYVKEINQKIILFIKS